MKETSKLKLSKKGTELLEMYNTMVKEGYDNGRFNPKYYKKFLKRVFAENKIKTVLDYGSGRGNWNDVIAGEVDSGLSALEYFQLEKVYQYEPTIANSKKQTAECVLCFDVLEHIFISDLKNVITDIYNHASKMVILQIACYEASAELPNGENAHVTVRDQLWWKGFLDSISLNHESISTVLICSTQKNPRKTTVFKSWSSGAWNECENYEIERSNPYRLRNGSVPLSAEPKKAKHGEAVSDDEYFAAWLKGCS